MILSVDLSWILDVARMAGQDDPAPLDFGVPIAAVERHRAVLTGQDVYSGPYVRAAALAHTLGRLHWLERSNLRVAVAAAHGYLVASGIDVKLSQDGVTALATELRRQESSAESVAAVLRSWSS